MISIHNSIGLNGIEFVEFTSRQPARLDQLFKDFGFSKVMYHREQEIDLYRQNEIVLLINRSMNSFASRFAELHGPSISSMGWRVFDAKRALEVAKKRGASVCERGNLFKKDGTPVPAIFGIGESLIYFIDQFAEPGLYEKMGFEAHQMPERIRDKGFLLIDHLTNNVPKGTMKKWADFYKDIFGFTEVRYFDIRGVKTGLQSYALRSPCETFCIPINEADEEKSQINEYLREYNGPGIQHLAFLTEDIVNSLAGLKGTSIQTLDIDDQYYREVFERVPHVTEDRKVLRDMNILIDGDEQGYLLQIFTKNLIGPIFIEIIQRKNHLSFGEGNFSALFRSIERDQAKRGVFGTVGMGEKA